MKGDYQSPVCEALEIPESLILCSSEEKGPDENNDSNSVYPYLQQRNTAVAPFQQLSHWLRTLQTNASPAVKEVFNAQLSIIRFVQSPTLIDSTLDTLLYSLERAFTAASSVKEREDIREVFCLMINNYVFYMDAKYQIEVNNNRAAGRELFIEAGELLIDTLKDVVSMAIGGGDVSGIINSVVNQVTSINDNGGLQSFLDKLYCYIHREDILYEQQRSFYETLCRIIEKLGQPDVQILLGKSSLLARMIKRHLPELKVFYCQYDLDLTNLRSQEARNVKIGRIICCIWIIVALFATFARYLFSSSWKAPWMAGWMLWLAIILAGIIGVFYVKNLIIKDRIKKRKLQWDELINNYHSIGNTYGDVY